MYSRYQEADNRQDLPAPLEITLTAGLRQPLSNCQKWFRRNKLNLSSELSPRFPTRKQYAGDFLDQLQAYAQRRHVNLKKTIVLELHVGKTDVKDPIMIK